MNHDKAFKQVSTRNWNTCVCKDLMGVFNDLIWPNLPFCVFLRQPPAFYEYCPPSISYTWCCRVITGVLMVASMVPVQWPGDEELHMWPYLPPPPPAQVSSGPGYTLYTALWEYTWQFVGQYLPLLWLSLQRSFSFSFQIWIIRNCFCMCQVMNFHKWIYKT